MKNISILGSTGSIGVNTLDVIARNPSRFKVVALTAGRNLSLLKKQINKFKPEVVSVIDDEHAGKLREMLGHLAVPKILSGEGG
ncbi:MAG: 1-deoxy-D-xylulose-5-phosphate reductoisomerase, partial [Deltaproteobacteria bacterium]|nr:1-deoxy-D-xylulose-5-phosphate reductoisomerase [Deltaproteobacteria bacterium]